MGLQPMEIEVFWSWGVKRTGESRHHRQTTTDVRKKFQSCPFRSTALLAFPHSSWMTCTGHSSMLNPVKTCHRPYFNTRSKAVLKSMSSRWCCSVSQC
ncbi:hypothetical protein DPMN_045282 [Dreissena polymorpha]|uniref:Uncharacterized protein n=1 Tax=Dreissena polymorpha TaxID=45954 RepID=A0A9D4D438_DREPO|nr:hypothetical protein DPMN_045282 [Dreissena polymorpha]